MNAAQAMHQMLSLLQESPLVEVALAHGPFATPEFIIADHEKTFGSIFPQDYRDFLIGFGSFDISWRFKEQTDPPIRINFLPVPKRHPMAAEDEDYKDLYVVKDNWDLDLLCLRLQSGEAPQWVWHNILDCSLSVMSKLSFEQYILRSAPLFFVEDCPDATPWDIESLGA